MDFTLNEDLQGIKDLVKEFATNEIRPLAADWDRNDSRIPVEISQKLGELGLLGLTVPEEYGGINLGYLALAVAIEELTRNSRASISYSLLSGPNGSYSAPILHFGTEEQKKKYLPGVLSGKENGAMAITEPTGSSALKGMATTATPDGDNYIVNGQKVFITRADTASWFITIAQAPEGPIALIVDRDLKGVSVGPSEHKMGHRGMGLNPVYYDNVVVPKTALLGNIGDGLKIASDSLYEARMDVAAASVGMAQAAVDLAVEYSQQRMIGNNKLSSFQNTQFVLAEAQTKIDACRLLVWRCADAMDKGTHEYYMSSMAKYYCSECATEIVDKCLQIYGGYGYCGDYEIERIYRDVRVLRILDGATEIHKRLISKYMGVR